MKSIKNKRKQVEQIKDIPSSEYPIADETPVEEMASEKSIEEFLELKKLQNRILEKILDKMNQSENQDKINNTKIEKK